MSLEQVNRYSPIIAFVACFLLEIIVIMLSYWPLTIIPAIIGGFICLEMKWGALSGLLAVLLAWILAFLFAINDIVLQADQLGRLIIDSSGAGGLIVFVIFIIGALFGLLGGTIGSGIRLLVSLESNNPRK